MPIQREFIDWRPACGGALARAADYLHKRFGRPGELNLCQVVIVVPGGRAARRLLEILVALADEHRLSLTPPEIITPESLPEKLYQPKRQFADGLTQQLAWAKALQSVPSKLLASFLPHPPEPHDMLRWLAVGKTLCSLHTELAADGINCRKVLEEATAVEGFAEHQRWEVLCELQRIYLQTLDVLELWDVQTARLVAIEKREIATDKLIMLLGTADLNRAQRLMLDQIADRVTALIVAPQELAHRFDKHGCLIASEWTEAELPLADEQIEPVDGPADQAEAVTQWLSSLGGRYRADEIAIGLPDGKLAPQIERQLAQCGIEGRWVIGKQLCETGPYRLLRLAADYVARRRFRDLAALVRHPDVFDWLAGSSQPAPRLLGGAGVLTALDCFASDHFPASLDEDRLAKDERAAELRAIYRAVERLVKPLAGKSKRLGAWAEPLRAVLAAIYGSRELDRQAPIDRYLIATLEHLREALDALAAMPDDLQPAVDARQACRILLDELTKEGIAPPAKPEAIEMLGWLDLPLDDAPAVIVTTFNEGRVPQALTSDAFLPNRLRVALDLMHNDRRLARDAYALSVLLASRAELRLIVAHRDAEGNPLAPSRLLFAADADRMAARAQRLFAPGAPRPPGPRRNLLLPTSGPRSKSLLAPPRPERLKEPLGELSVTSFRDYIACPYRFYLRHLLKLEALSDQAAELDGAAFGNLVHYVLERFGRDKDAADARQAVDPKKIFNYLESELDRIAGGLYGGKYARPAVRVQIEQVRLRLRAFAEWQAQRTREGWRIVFSEDSEERVRFSAGLPVDGQPFTISGRIDRIDYNEEANKLLVLDYKTGDAGLAPEKTHRHGEEWADLQLPLYRHLVREAELAARLPKGAKIDLGYVLLPRDLNAVGLALADWDEATLESADEKAREIIRAIRDERFWPPKMPPPAFCDELAVICQDHRMGSWAAGPEGDAA